MATYEKIKSDMTKALKEGNKARRAVLADIVATIDKAAIAGKTRVEITDQLTNEVLTKYKKTVQEMIDTCPDTEQYAARKAEYIANMAIVNEYAPKLIEDEVEIEAMIVELCAVLGADIIPANRGAVTKAVMPVLKKSNCNMKKAQGVLNKLFK